MNKDAILKVAKAIEEVALYDKSELGFSMNTFGAEPDGERVIDQTGHECSTVACIAGWTLVVLDLVKPKELQSQDSISYRAKKLLGLDQWTADQLFWGWDLEGNGVIDLAAAKPLHAVGVLRHLAETGQVDWLIGEKQEVERT